MKKKGPKFENTLPRPISENQIIRMLRELNLGRKKMGVQEKLIL